MTTEVGGDSIPNVTGTPLEFPSTFTTRGGGGITPSVPPVPPATVGTPGVNEPTWETLLPLDVVGITTNQVNWGLMTFQDISSDSTQSNWCKEAGNYNPLVPVVSDDSGDVTAIEDYLRLKYFSGGGHPGLGAAGGTPTKGALHHAGDSLEDTWNADQKKQCQRPYGIILCTDGLSNTCNTGATPDQVWEPVDYNGVATLNTPCEDDKTGTDL